MRLVNNEEDSAAEQTEPGGQEQESRIRNKKEKEQTQNTRLSRALLIKAS